MSDQLDQIQMEYDQACFYYGNCYSGPKLAEKLQQLTEIYNQLLQNPPQRQIIRIKQPDQKKIVF